MKTLYFSTLLAMSISLLNAMEGDLQRLNELDKKIEQKSKEIQQDKELVHQQLEQESRKVSGEDDYYLHGSMSRASRIQERIENEEAVLKELREEANRMSRDIYITRKKELEEFMAKKK